MKRADELRAAIERCRDREAYAHKTFEMFVVGADLNDPEATRHHRKLANDITLAQSDIEALQSMLDREFPTR